MICPSKRETNGCWAKATFAEHLENVFKPFPSQITDYSSDQIVSSSVINFLSNYPTYGQSNTARNKTCY